MIKIFELYLRGRNKVIQYLHDWYNYIQDCEEYQNNVEKPDAPKTSPAAPPISDTNWDGV